MYQIERIKEIGKFVWKDLKSVINAYKLRINRETNNLKEIKHTIEGSHEKMKLSEAVGTDYPEGDPRRCDWLRPKPLSEEEEEKKEIYEFIEARNSIRRRRNQNRPVLKTVVKSKKGPVILTT